MDSLGAERDASLFFFSPPQINFQFPRQTQTIAIFNCVAPTRGL
jgi:hypothetical protein